MTDAVPPAVKGIPKSADPCVLKLDKNQIAKKTECTQEGVPAESGDAPISGGRPLY